MWNNLADNQFSTAQSGGPLKPEAKTLIFLLKTFIRLLLLTDSFWIQSTEGNSR
jgi:hypothetical protein